MTDNRTRLKAAVLAALGYIAIMAVGMFTSGHVFGIPYGAPEMTLVLLPFEVVMSLYALVMARRLFGHWQCGFGPVDWRGLWWLAPSFLVVAALFLGLFLTGTVTLTGLALAVVATMILVGFSEELVFRGIVLKAALPAMATGRAILLSAALFASLHAVNVLAFLPVSNMLLQLVLTFTFGLAIACFALRVNSLVPVITFHALWDMVQFLGGLWGADFGLLVTLGILVNVIAGAALWWRVLRKRG